MLTQAYFERQMKDYEEQIKRTPKDAETIKNKALNDVTHVLKQYGYDKGADIFNEIIKK